MASVQGDPSVLVVDHDHGMLRHLTIEMRHLPSYSFISRRWALIEELLDVDPGWEVDQRAAAPTAVQLVNLNSGAVLAFQPDRFAMSIDHRTGADPFDRTVVADFLSDLVEIWAVVADSLHDAQPTRFGCRAVYHFGQESIEDIARWAERLGVCNVSPAFHQALGSEAESFAYRLTLRLKTSKLNLAVEGVQQLRQQWIERTTTMLTLDPSRLSQDQDIVRGKRLEAMKKLKLNRRFAAVVDLDHHLDSMDLHQAASNPTPPEFLADSLNTITEAVSNALTTARRDRAAD